MCGRGVIAWGSSVPDSVVRSGLRRLYEGAKRVVRRLGKSLTLGLAFCIVFLGFVGFHALRHGRVLL